ncbi:MAG: hypothetical protein F6K28_50580 [Microcoleus sp. SIO2G3]|nr:hypothetical protein [Microcoleus sp. SIO2G3]
MTTKRPAAGAIVRSEALPIDFTRRPVSSKHLDLVLLACCSCLLTLMCHSTANLLPGSSAASGITLEASQAASSGQTSFYVKSALMSAYQGRERKAADSVDS